MARKLEMKKLTDQHIVLINRIRQCIMRDEINHIWRLVYTREWVVRFLDKIELAGKYQEHQGKVLMEIRNVFIEDLRLKYKQS